jgi:2'-5' RNA ligase
MPRYFIALLPPVEFQDYANQVRQHFADCYASRKAFNSPPHITLHSPFEWALDERDKLVVRLIEFARSLPAIPVTLQGFGAFPPRVIYINVGRSTELLALQNQLQQYCELDLGILNPDVGRSFMPHMTVAFRDLTPENFKFAWPLFESQSLALSNASNGQYQFVATELTLLQHHGQRWQVDGTIGLNSD